MTVDQATLARVNLFALLRNIEDLTELDEEARLALGGRRVSVGFYVDGAAPDGGRVRGRLDFEGGRARFARDEGGGSIRLWFPRPERLSGMVAGTASPIPVAGLARIGFLTGPFTKAADRLGAVLRGEPADRAGAVLKTTLTFYAAAFACAEIANGDPRGREAASRMAPGPMLVHIENGPAVTVEKKDGRVACWKGAPAKPRAVMRFADFDAAAGVLGGTLDAFAAIATGKLEMRGYIPIVESFDKFLGLVPAYLS